jgi:hypothetical protein
LIEKRRDLKQRLLEDKKRWGTSINQCEGQAFRQHACSGGLHMNEVLYPRNIFSHMSAKEKEYFWHEFNCSINCAWFHEKYGHSRAFRKWFLRRLSYIYSGADVANYIGNAPLKIKRPKGGLG